MNLTENEMTGPVVRSLREGVGLSQKAFWGPLGVKQSVGCKYESDTPIPHSVRILIVATYISGLKIDARTGEAVAELSKLGSIQAAFQQASSTAATVRDQLDHAAHQLQQARSTLAGI